MCAIESTPACAPSAFDRLANKATKWAITGVATGVLLWRHDAAAMWAITGAVLNVANAKILKRCINQGRPASALDLKIDPGMPSSHAQSLGYLSTYAAIGIVGSLGTDLVSLLLCAIVLGCAAYLAHLRVATGLHSAAQVGVGGAIGIASAAIWSWAWAAIVEHYAAELSWISIALWIVFFVAASSFLAFGIKNWRIGDA